MGHVGSVVVVPGLQSTGSIAVAHGLGLKPDTLDHHRVLNIVDYYQSCGIHADLFSVVLFGT